MKGKCHEYKPPHDEKAVAKTEDGKETRILINAVLNSDNKRGDLEIIREPAETVGECSSDVEEMKKEEKRPEVTGDTSLIKHFGQKLILLAWRWDLKAYHVSLTTKK